MAYEHVNEHVNDDIKRELEVKMVVDLDQLRKVSNDRIPVNSRKNVWKYLLLVTTVDKSEEMTLARKKEDEYFGHFVVVLFSPPLASVEMSTRQSLEHETHMRGKILPKH
ncbi:hypothetical protein DIPPA_05469 [Diplonema papillatum]|nr:hypothetical protein DIPPA_05469 [Diplonema papillatum]